MIANPIKYCDEDLELVNAFNALVPESKAGAYWSDDELEGLRSRVKAFYIAGQKTRCCYCNRHLGSDNHRLWDVEHVASRAKHAHFMFEPTNLAASCPDCNTNKGEQSTLTNTNRKTYPKTSNDFKIIHPHFDRFEEHIQVFGMVYLPKTTKGKKTIYTCDLLRFAQKFIAWENSAADMSFEKDIDAVFKEEPLVSQAAVEAIVVKLNIK